MTSHPAAWSRSEPAFPDALEGVQPIGDADLWTESFHGSGYDPQRRVGVFVHVARAQFDPTLWDETFVAFLPDGRLLAYRSFGAGEEPSGPTANAVDYRCEEPWARWKLGFRGGVRLVTESELDAAALTDDEYVGAELALDLRAIGPVCGIGGMDDAFWAHAHTEQHLSVSGTLRWGGEEIAFDGTGLRDHSVGPRDVSVLDRHTWCHGEFPSGRLFMVMDVDAGDGTTLRYAVVGDGDGMHEATITRPGGTLLDAPGGARDGYAVGLDTSDGSTTIEAEILHTLPLSLRGTNSWVVGTRPDAHHFMYESMTRFTWDGETGYGLTERSVPS